MTRKYISLPTILSVEKCQENIKEESLPPCSTILHYLPKPKLCCFHGTTANQKGALFQVSFTAMWLWLSLLSSFQKNISKNDVLVWPNSFMIYKLISSVGESHYTSFAFWKNGLYICDFLCLYFINLWIKAVFCRFQLWFHFLLVSWQGDHGKSSHQ